MDLADFKKEVQNNPFAVLNDLVYEYLLEQIVYWHVKPTERLRESRIAKKLEVSRSPVRTALQKLLAVGLLYQDENQNYYVYDLDPEDCIDLYTARYLIEGKAAYLAAGRISDAELDLLEECVYGIEQAMRDLDLVNAAEWDQKFHQVVVDAAGNDYIKEMYASMLRPLSRYKFYLHSIFEDNSGTKESFMKILKRHRVILEAMRNHISIVAQSEIENDIDNMLHTLHVLIRKKYS